MGVQAELLLFPLCQTSPVYINDEPGKVAVPVALSQPVHPMLWHQPAHPEQPWALNDSSGLGGHGPEKKAQVFHLSSLRGAKHFGNWALVLNTDTAIFIL